MAAAVSPQMTSGLAPPTFGPILPTSRVPPPTAPPRMAVPPLNDAIAVLKLSEELMAYESYMKFYEIPYLDGQSAAAPEPIVGGGSLELWSFDDVNPSCA
nr:ethylene-responsive transcription factor ERF071-like [Ipomoea batatas]GMD68904.1 ethylene-responsive transcription factor ERF071-like [Ipomoea batatas]